jgi:hypothetical protein
MTNFNFDVIIIGSGPAGVSAGFPLAKSGLRILMVDGGYGKEKLPPEKNFIEWRTNNVDQFSQMIGNDYHFLKMYGMGASPKLRVPALDYVFKDFKSSNRISSSNFSAIGSLAKGGLSNAWGCGVACFSDKELSSFPFPAPDLRTSYAEVANRIGVSGGLNDDMSDYFGLDEFSQSPIELDLMHKYFLDRYNIYRNQLISQNFRMGRPRLAILSKDLKDRKACSLTGNCLWGCHRRSLYSALHEIPELLKHKNFNYLPGFLVSNIVKHDVGWTIEGRNLSKNIYESICSSKIFLAAGTIASTRLALKTSGYYGEVPILSCPTAAFMVWAPKFLGTKRTPSFGSGQLAFNIDISKNVNACGSTFSTTGIPVAEFLAHLPFSARYGADILRNLLSSCVVGNFFLPGSYGAARAKLNYNDDLVISYSVNPELTELMRSGRKILNKSYRKLGGILLPGSFKIGTPGGDIHYSGTLPMRKEPGPAETSWLGELSGCKGIYLVDGSSLSSLPEKPHTLTIMANADRIAKKVVEKTVGS